MKPLLLARRLVLVFAATTVTAGCDLLSTACPADLQTRVSPRDTVLAVGQSFQPSAGLYGCGGRDRIRTTIRYTSRDTSLVRVDSASSRLYALRPGTTFVDVIAAEPYGLVGQIRVQVGSVP